MAYWIWKGKSGERGPGNKCDQFPYEIVNKMKRIKIIHGHGMGTVKRFVRDYLESCNIGSVIPGKREDGGDGVTIVEF